MYHHLISRGIGNDGKKIQTLRNVCFWYNYLLQLYKIDIIYQSCQLILKNFKK